MVSVYHSALSSNQHVLHVACPTVPQSVALDPRYGSRKAREFVTGGLAGQLLYVSKARPHPPAGRQQQFSLCPGTWQEGNLCNTRCSI